MDRKRSATSCSFCGKPRDQARRMVAGPGVFICADCVQLCSEILAIDASQPPALPAQIPTGSFQRRGERPPLAARWKGLLRRLRVWPAWSG